MSTRNFRADVTAELKARRKLLLSQGQSVADIDATLAQYGVQIEAPVESKQEPAPTQTATPSAPETAAQKGPEPAKPTQKVGAAPEGSPKRGNGPTAKPSASKDAG